MDAKGIFSLEAAARSRAPKAVSKTTHVHRVGERYSVSTAASTGDSFDAQCSDASYLYTFPSPLVPGPWFSPCYDTSSPANKNSRQKSCTYRIRYAMTDDHHRIHDLHPDLPADQRGYGAPIEFAPWQRLSSVVGESLWKL